MKMAITKEAPTQEAQAVDEMGDAVAVGEVHEDAVQAVTVLAAEAAGGNEQNEGPLPTASCWYLLSELRSTAMS